MEFQTVRSEPGRLIMTPSQWIERIKNKNGIRYASVYSPIEYSGANQLATFDGVGYGNYVLTQKGYENLELVSVEKKKAEKIQGLEVLISVFARNMM